MELLAWLWTKLKNKKKTEKYKKFQELKIAEGEIWDNRFSKHHRMWFVGEQGEFIVLYVEHEPSGQHNETRTVYYLDKYNIEKGKVRLETVNG
jgi:hypothetical protein